MSVLPVSIARENLSSVIEESKTEPVYLEKHGKPIAVVVSVEHFNELEKFRSDNKDTAAAYEILLEKFVNLQSKSFVQN
jgi:antitoxin Phd